MKRSALFFAAAAVLVSANAFADTRKSCDYSDYVLLTQVLNGHAIIQAGAELKGEVIGMLTEEMGPKCELIIPTAPVIGIPGDKFSNYELSSGERMFKITVVNRGVEGGYRTDLYLSKGNN